MKLSRVAALLLGLLCFSLWALPGPPAATVPLTIPANSPLRLVSDRPAPPSDASELVEMQVKDVVPIEEAQTHAVMLVSQEGTVLPIFVEESAAIAIAFRLAHREPPHALGEDLLDEMLKQMGGEVTQVQLDDVQNHQARSLIIVRQGKRTHSLQARASDSIAVALSSGARIFVTKRLMDAAGITKEEIETLREQMGIGGSGEPVPPAPPGEGNEIKL